MAGDSRGTDPWRLGSVWLHARSWARDACAPTPRFDWIWRWNRQQHHARLGPGEVGKSCASEVARDWSGRSWQVRGKAWMLGQIGPTPPACKASNAMARLPERPAAGGSWRTRFPWRVVPNAPKCVRVAKPPNQVQGAVSGFEEGLKTWKGALPHTVNASGIRSEKVFGNICETACVKGSAESLANCKRACARDHNHKPKVHGSVTNAQLCKPGVPPLTEEQCTAFHRCHPCSFHSLCHVDAPFQHDYTRNELNARSRGRLAGYSLAFTQLAV